MAQGHRELTISVYHNKKDEHRLAIQMSYDFAMRIAADDEEALDMVRAAITKRIELLESRASGS